MSDLQRKRKLTKKGLILSAACGFLLATAAGCGKAEEEGLQIEAIGEERDAFEDGAAGDADENAGDGAAKDADENAGDGAADDTDENAGEDGAADDTDENAGEDGAVKNADENTGDADQSAGGGAAQSVGGAKLEGDVLSLSKDSFVVARNETFEEGDASYMVGAAPGYEAEEDRITVHTAQNCAYTYKTIKNGGVNPGDVSTREGSFADMREGLMVIIKGSWQEDGSFLADSIEMEEFV